MKFIFLGAVLREHKEDKYLDIGRVVHIDDTGEHYWWIPFPEHKPVKQTPVGDTPATHEDDTITKRKADAQLTHVDANSKSLSRGRRQAYIKRPRRGKVSEAEELKQSGKLSTTRFTPPPEWTLTDDQLKSPKTNEGPLRRSRRKLHRWIDLRDKQWALIKPIVSRATELNTTVGHLLESGEAYAVIERYCSEAVDTAHQTPASQDEPAVKKPPNKQAVEQALFRYMLGGCEKNALLGGWMHCGNLGTTKISRKKTGRPNKQARLNMSDARLRGYVCTAVDRANLARGWKRYLVGDTTEEQAYLATMEEYYCESVTYVGPGRRIVKLLDPLDRPTQWEFRTHGPAKRPEAKPSRIHMGEIAYSQNKRALKGKANDGILAVGQVGWIDSTPEDQNLVSAASRLKQLPTSHRTMIVDGGSDYILGIYAGFERSSTMTGLLALLHAGSSKVDWCARWGVEIEEGDWLSFTPRRLRGDNGDLKSDDGIATLLASEVGLEVVRAWWASHKGPVETKHMVLHRQADHLIAGTSRGRQRKRGERRADEDSCLTFAEKMPTLIRAILMHNNDEHVPHLRTMEMRNDNVTPTRRAIFEWRVKNGYVVSEPTQLDLLKAKCLPKFKGRIDGSCVRLYDPREPKGTRLIPELEYWSAWLHKSGLTTRGAKKVIDCELQLDPTYPAEAWLNADGMHRLQMRTSDPLKRQVTLCDWILITDDDNLREFLDRGELQNKRATHQSSARAANETGAEAKQAELDETPQPPSTKEQTGKKRTNLEEELAQQKLEQAGLASLGPAPTQYELPASPPGSEIDLDDDPLMALIRQRAQL